MKDRVVEKTTGITIETKVIAEIGIGTGLEKDHPLETIILEEMMEVWVKVGPDQDQEQVQIEIESGATNVGNMIILQEAVLHPGKKVN